MERQRNIVENVRFFYLPMIVSPSNLPEKNTTQIINIQALTSIKLELVQKIYNFLHQWILGLD